MKYKIANFLIMLAIIGMVAWFIMIVLDDMSRNGNHRAPTIFNYLGEVRK